MIDDITIDLWSSINFTSTKNIRKKCNLLCNNGFDKIYIKQKDIKCVFELAFTALRFSFYVFSFFFFFFYHVFPPSQAATVHVLYMNSSHNIWPVLREQCIHALFTEPQISFFINFLFKNGSHGTIYTFKNYFATVISAINFQFQQNKSYPNRPYVKLYPSVINKFIAKLFSKI